MRILETDLKSQRMEVGLRLPKDAGGSSRKADSLMSVSSTDNTVPSLKVNFENLESERVKNQNDVQARMKKVAIEKGAISYLSSMPELNEL